MIDDKSSDIQGRIHEKLSDGRVFVLQLDASTDIRKQCQLLSYIRFVDDNSITEQFFRVLNCIHLQEDVYNAISSTLEQSEVSWESIFSVCTDSASAMIGRFKGFVVE